MQNICSVKDCGLKHYALSYCRKHHMRFRRNGTVKSKVEVHGLSKTSEYSVWANMKARCNNPSAFKYEYYGGRGIKVCDKWNKSFLSFYKDMGKRPSSKHTLDRIDNNSDYSPENCRWVTWDVQARNKRMGIRNKSGYVGVFRYRMSDRWAAQMRRDNTTIHLGYFDTPEEAALCRVSAEAQIKVSHERI